MSFSDKMKLRLYIKKMKYKKIKRDKKTVTSDYDQGIWNEKYENIDFESIPGMYGKKPESMSLFVKDNKIFKGKYSDYTEKFQNQLFDIISEHAVNYPIVELGCGLGANLFQLHKRGFKNIEGYDVSKNAIDLAKKHSIEKGYNINFDVLDLTKPLPNKIIENKIVFTNTCLEQLKHSMSIVLKNILNGKPKIVINFEVDYDSSDSLVKDYFDACDYQNNFVSELKNMQKQINIISINQLPLALSPVNRLSSIIWKPI